MATESHVQDVAAVAWECIKECKDHQLPPVMCLKHQLEAERLLGGGPLLAVIAGAGVLGELQKYIQHNAVLPSDHVGDGLVVPLSVLRGWIQREVNKLRMLTREQVGP